MPAPHLEHVISIVAISEKLILTMVFAVMFLLLEVVTARIREFCGVERMGT
jgi:hypothetical protein